MVDPSLTLLSALALIFSRLPAPYISLVGVSAVLAAFLIIIRIIRGL